MSIYWFNHHVELEIMCSISTVALVTAGTQDRGVTKVWFCTNMYDDSNQTIYKKSHLSLSWQGVFVALTPHLLLLQAVSGNSAFNKTFTWTAHISDYSTFIFLFLHLKGLLFYLRHHYLALLHILYILLLFLLLVVLLTEPFCCWLRMKPSSCSMVFVVHL